MEDLNYELNGNKASAEMNEEAVSPSKKMTNKDRDRLEKIDEVSEARDSLISRTESMHNNRRGTGFFDSLNLPKTATTGNSMKKIGSNEIDNDEKAGKNGTGVLSNEEKSELGAKSSLAMLEIQEEKLEEIEEEKTNDVIVVEDNDQLIQNEERIKLLLMGKEINEKKEDRNVSQFNHQAPQNFLRPSFDSQNPLRPPNNEPIRKSAANSTQILPSEIKSLESLDSLRRRPEGSFLSDAPSEKSQLDKLFRSRKQETVDPEQIKYDGLQGNFHHFHPENPMKTGKESVPSVPKVIKRKEEREKKGENQNEVRKWTTIVDAKKAEGDSQNLNYKSVVNFYSKTNQNKYYKFI